MGKVIAYAMRLFILMSVLLLSACDAGRSPAFSDQCSPPCWRAVEPGKTSTQETLKLVKDFPDVDIQSIETIAGSWYIFNNYMTFKLRTNEVVRIYMLNDVVTMIDLSNPRGISSLETYITAFGTPQYAAESRIVGPGIPILPSDDVHTWFFGLAPSKGIAFGHDTLNVWFGPNYDLGPHTMISDIRFFNPKNYDELLENGFLVDTASRSFSGRLYPWKGFGDIRQLYPEN